MSNQMDLSVGRRDRLLQHVESFFREHLQRTRGASRHTLLSYRDSLQLFFCYLADGKGRDVSKLRLDDITENRVLAFLDHLEAARGNGVATRNSRLTAIKSLCRYLIRKDTTHAAEYGLIVSIAAKKAPKPDIPYLEPAEVKLLLEQANQDELLGLRDYALIQFLYNTGVRVSEALSLSVGAPGTRRPWSSPGARERAERQDVPVVAQHDGASKTLHSTMEARGRVTAFL